MLDILLNPNVAYLLLWAGITMALLAVLSPGTGVLEIGALICLTLSGYAIINLQINYWALGIMLLGVVFFLLEIRYSDQWIYLALSIFCLVVGSIFLFREENWWDPAVNPFLALVVSGLTATFFWFATRKVLEARMTMPSHDLKVLDGKTGEAKSDIHRDGSVQIGSELWSAISEEPIRKGTEIRVTSRDGFTLTVEPVDQPED